jgi:hypothetical protein
MSYTTRARRRDGEKSPHFVPAFSIMREVLVDDGVAEELQREISEKLRQEASKKNSKLKPSLVGHLTAHHHTRLSMTVVERSMFIRLMRDADMHPTADGMEQLAYSVRDGLEKLLKDTDRPLRLPLGQLAKFGEGDDKRKIGVVPNGWRGFGARYADRDEAGKLTPLGLIVAENELCVGAITNAMADHPRFMSGGLTRTPHVTLLTKADKIREHEMRLLAPIISDSLPDEFNFSDPRIFLKTGRRAEDAQVLEVQTPYN